MSAEHGQVQETAQFFSCLSGEYIPPGHKGHGRGGDHREGQEENGAGSFGDPAYGHYWPNCSGQ